MQQDGWSWTTIRQIDEGAIAPPAVGYRTNAQINGSRRKVYRGKEFANADEKWDLAQKWTVIEESEWQHQKRARKARAGWPWWTSYSSSSWQ